MSQNTNTNTPINDLDASLNYLLNMAPPIPASASTSTPTLSSSAILTNIIANMTTNTIIDDNDPIITLPIPSRSLRQPLFHSYIDNNNIDIDTYSDNYNTRRQNYRESLHAISSIFNTSNFLSDINFQDDDYIHGNYNNYNRNPELVEILNNSLNEPPPFRNVITKKEKSKLKRVKYAEIEEKDISCCPITQEDFKDDDDIIVLPCKHYFSDKAIINWLENENAVCPICRYKFESVEVKNTEGDEEKNEENEENEQSELIEPMDEDTEDNEDNEDNEDDEDELASTSISLLPQPEPLEINSSTEIQTSERDFIQTMYRDSSQVLIENLLMNLINTPDV